MKPANNQFQKPTSRIDVIAGAITALILVVTTAWLVTLLF